MKVNTETDGGRSALLQGLTDSVREMLVDLVIEVENEGGRVERLGKLVQVTRCDGRFYFIRLSW